MNAYCLGENFSTLRITQTNILISIITMGIDYEMTPLSNQSYWCEQWCDSQKLVAIDMLFIVGVVGRYLVRN